MGAMPSARAAIETRPLTIADAAELAALAARAGGRETKPDWSRLLARSEVVGVGAIVDGHLVGYAAGTVRAGFGLPAPTAWVEAFGIDLEERGHGVGRTLLQGLLLRFRAAGARHVYTVVPVHDRSLAPFFRQLGFQSEPLDLIGCAL